MKININFQKILCTFLALTVTVSSFTISTYGRRTVEDIQKEIDQKNAEMAQVTNDTKALEATIAENQKALQNATGRRQTAKAQISLNQSQINLLKQQIADLQKKHELNVLEQEERKLRQNNIVLEAYLGWKQDSMIRSILSENNQDPIKVAVYQSSVTHSEQQSIETLQKDLTNIEADIKKSEEDKKLFENKINELQAQVSEIEKQIAELDKKVNENKTDLGNYRARLGSIKMEIDELTKEQEEVQQYEAYLMGTAKNGGTKSLVKGELYFKGVGRETYQGHGVGMSQFGALGAAVNGWSAEKIVEFYYPGAKVKEYTARSTIKVDGFGEMSLEKYVAGAGEVPDFSCEDLDLKFDSNDMWKCWPKEAIKAQAIAYRTYGLHATQGGNSICTSAKCQVYKGGENKKWAAEDTKNLVIMYDGGPISAFYSSDNNNGWGTANNDTVWSNFSGTGTPKPYLRAVQDKDITYTGPYTYWTWRTNSYSISEIDEMLKWSITSDKASDSYKSFLTGVKNKIGKLKKLRFERDPSGRVAKVQLEGENGSEYIAGWLFKSAWNIWIGNEEPSGEKDFIYSLTYYMMEAE